MSKAPPTVANFKTILDGFIKAQQTELTRIKNRTRGRLILEEIPEDCDLCKVPCWIRFRLLYCNHVFCKQCLKNHLQDQHDCQEFCCPTCRNPIALYDILNLFSQVELEDLFAQLKVEFLSKKSDRFRYCPTPNCENILEKTGDSLMMFCTVCGYDSCFECSKSHYDSACSSKRTSTRLRGNKGGNKDPNDFGRCPHTHCNQPLQATETVNLVECTRCMEFKCSKCANYLPQKDERIVKTHIAKQHGFKK